MSPSAFFYSMDVTKVKWAWHANETGLVCTNLIQIERIMLPMQHEDRGSAVKICGVDSWSTAVQEEQAQGRGDLRVTKATHRVWFE